MGTVGSGNKTNHTHRKGGNHTNHPNSGGNRNGRKPRWITVNGITNHLSGWSNFLGYNTNWASQFLKSHTEEELIVKIEKKFEEERTMNND